MQLLADGTTDCVHVLAQKMTEIENLGHLQEKKYIQGHLKHFHELPTFAVHKDIKFQRVQNPKG